MKKDRTPIIVMLITAVCFALDFVLN